MPNNLLPLTSWSTILNCELVVEKISPVSDEINRLQKDIKYIDDVLKQGAEKANKIASKKINDMKKIVGF